MCKTTKLKPPSFKSLIKTNKLTKNNTKILKFYIIFRKKVEAQHIIVTLDYETIL